MNTGLWLAVFAVTLLLVAALISRSFRRARALSPDEAATPHDFVALVVHPGGSGGWTLDRRGNIVAFGGAPEFREVPLPDPWRQEPFVAMACTPSGRGLWILDRKGNIFAFGDAPEFREIPHTEPWRESFVAIASTPTGRGVWILDRRGNVLPFGDAAEVRLARPRS